MLAILKTKKQVLAVLASAAMVVGMTGVGCDKPLGAGGMADAATKDLGVPVFLWALDGDVCASRQLKVLFDDYGRRNGSGRAALSNQFKTNYKAIVVLATKDQGDTTGVLKVVHLVDGHQHQLDSKIVVDTRANEGHKAPGTEIDKGDAANVEGKVLSLRPNSSTDKSVKSLYTTSNTEVFGLLGATPTEDAPNVMSIEDAISGGSISLVPQGFSDADLCGKLATVSDLF